jgi:glutaredoxin 3
MVTCFKNHLRGYDVILATLGAYSKDICRNCIGLSGAQTKVIKGLKKLKMDLEKFPIPEMEKEKILLSVESFFKGAEDLQLAEEVSCQKTAGQCKIGSGCFPLGALELMNQITEPTILPEKEVSKMAKLICQTCGAEEPVPIVHWGPGISGPEIDKLYCPCLPEGHTEKIDMPKHCDKPMKYVKWQRRKAVVEKEITIYTASTCPFCKAAKEDLDRKGIKYKEIDVSKDAEGLEKMARPSGKRLVPVMVNGENVTIGFGGTWGVWQSSGQLEIDIDFCL